MEKFQFFHIMIEPQKLVFGEAQNLVYWLHMLGKHSFHQIEMRK